MYKQFGKTNLKTSPIVFGCMGSAGDLGAQDEKDSIEAIRTAYDIGINFFDTAEVYGHGYSEQLLHKALGNKRKDIVIVDKVAPKHMKKEQIISACEQSLKTLGTDYIDIYLLHWPVYDVPIDDRLEALELLKKQGKIQYFGVSNFGKQNLAEILPKADICTNEVVYNLLYRCIEQEVLPICKKEQIPILTYSSLMQGLLAGKYTDISTFPPKRARSRHFKDTPENHCRHGENGYESETQQALDAIWKITKDSDFSMEELAAGWLKAQEGIGGVIVGTRNKKQSQDLRKLLDVTLSKEIINELTEATNKLKQVLGTNIDMWQHRPK